MPNALVALPAVAAVVVSAAAMVPPAAAQERPLDLVLVGDSISTGFGLSGASTFPARLRLRLELSGVPATLRVSARNGAAVADGVALVSSVGSADVVIVALGGNDLLRRTPVEPLAASLEAVLDRAAGVAPCVMLAGLRVPAVVTAAQVAPGWRAAFDRLFADAARRRRLVFHPDFLLGVALVPELNQLDGIHPNGVGADYAAANVWSVLGPLVSVLRAAPAGSACPGRW